MRLGLQVPNFTWPNGQENLGDTFSLIAQRAERAGFYSLWVMDHFFQIGMAGPPENEMLEGYTALWPSGQDSHYPGCSLTWACLFGYRRSLERRRASWIRRSLSINI